MPVMVGSVGSVLFMPAVVTSVDSELVCEIETPVGDQSTTELLTLVTVNYIECKFFCLSALLLIIIIKSNLPAPYNVLMYNSDSLYLK